MGTKKYVMVPPLISVVICHLLFPPLSPSNSRPCAVMQSGESAHVLGKLIGKQSRRLWFARSLEYALLIAQCNNSEQEFWRVLARPQRLSQLSFSLRLAAMRSFQKFLSIHATSHRMSRKGDSTLGSCSFPPGAHQNCKEQGG